MGSRSNILSNELSPKDSSKKVKRSKHLTETQYFNGIAQAWGNALIPIENTIRNLNLLIAIIDKKNHHELNALKEKLNTLKDLPAHKGHRDKVMNKIIEKMSDWLKGTREENNFPFKINTSLPRQGFNNFNRKRQHAKIENINTFLAAINAFNYCLAEDIQLNHQNKAPRAARRLVRENNDLSSTDLSSRHSVSESQTSLEDSFIFEDNNGHNRPNHLQRANSADEFPDMIVVTPTGRTAESAPELPSSSHRGFFYSLSRPFIWIGQLFYDNIPGVAWISNNIFSPILNAVSAFIRALRDAFQSLFHPRLSPKAETPTTLDLDFRDKGPLLSPSRTLQFKKSKETMAPETLKHNKTAPSSNKTLSNTREPKVVQQPSTAHAKHSLRKEVNQKPLPR